MAKKQEVKKHFPYNSIMQLFKFDSKEAMTECLKSEEFQLLIGKMSSLVLNMKGKAEIITNPEI